MTDDEKAQAVMYALAGVTVCPLCQHALQENHDWVFGMGAAPFNCANRDCHICCVDQHARPLNCRKDVEDVDGSIVYGRWAK